MNKRQTGRASTALRDAVFARDNNTCIDCRRQYPPEMLEADHDIELADGGTNNLENMVTRCGDHHSQKTEERRMARATATKKPPAKKGKADKPLTLLQTSEEPTRPAVRPHVAAVVGATGIGLLLVAAGSLLGRDDTALLKTLWSLLTLGSVVLYVFRWVHWRRQHERWRVFGALAKVAELSNAKWSEKFKVTEWDWFTPTKATIEPGLNFNWDDPTRVPVLGGLFGTAVGPGARGRATRAAHGGKVKLWIDHGADAQDARADDAPAQLPVPVAAGPVVARIRDGLAEVVDDDAQVQVTDWHDDGKPAVVTLTYPSRATARIGENLVRLRDTLVRLHTPHLGEWYLRWDSANDRLLFTDRPDPLAPIVKPAPVENDPDLYKGVQIGITEDGDPWLVPLMGGKHWLVAGASAAGKGSVLWGIVRALAPLIADGRCRLWIVDPKGGLEFDAAHAFAYRFAIAPDDCEVLLDELRTVMLSKAAGQAGNGRKIEKPTSEHPLDVLIVDEIANITAYVDSKQGKANADHIAALCSMGRAAGVTAIAAVQDPRKETVRNRGLFTAAVALRLSEATEVNLVLGSGVRAKGATADLIPTAHPGIGYVVREDQAGHARVRAAFIDDDEIARIAAECTVPRKPPAHSARAAGEQLPFPELPRGGEPVPVSEALPKVTKVIARKLPALFADTDRVCAMLPDDKDPVTIVYADRRGDRVFMSYSYDGEDQVRDHEFDDDELVTLL